MAVGRPACPFCAGVHSVLLYPLTPYPRPQALSLQCRETGPVLGSGPMWGLAPMREAEHLSFSQETEAQRGLAGVLPPPLGTSPWGALHGLTQCLFLLFDAIVIP